MDWIKNRKLILASGSPRRAELLKQSGFSFNVRTFDIDENYPDELEKNDVAEFLAIKKATAQKHLLKKDELILAADSIVLKKDQILGKPKDKIEATKMLSILSGEKHKVITGVCLLSIEKQISFSCCSVVFMEKLSKAEIEHYIDVYKPYDKAGAYGIQEWIGINRIKRIEGSYTNIMGLPTAELYEELLRF